MKSNKNAAAEASRLTFITFFQSIYLTFRSFLTNDLLSYAAACTFGFLFSFIPVIMMILVILIRILHLSPETVSGFIQPYLGNIDIINFSSFINSITQIHTVTNFEIVLGFAIIFMARRFFSSVIGGLRKIFGKEQNTNSIMMQLVILIGEAIIVIVISALIFVIVTTRTVIKFPKIKEFINQWPWFHTFISRFVTSYFPLILIFLIVTIAYKAGSRTKPRLLFSMIMSAGTTFVFWGYLLLMKLFLNMNKYNMIYGVLSNTIVLLSEVYFFFVIFLFFAQWLYVSQFFDTLLICELYLLPHRDDTNLISSLKRLLFIKPEFLLRHDSSVMKIQRNETIYSKSEDAVNVYYIFKGRIQISEETHVSVLEQGSFFGVESCIIEEPRQETAIALTDGELIKIPRDVFVNLVENAPEANKKALSQVSSYIVKLISNKNTNEQNDAAKQTEKQNETQLEVQQPEEK